MGFLNKIINFIEDKQKLKQNLQPELSVREKNNLSSLQSKPEIVSSKGIEQLYGLNIGQVILLNWLNGRDITADYPGYFSYRYEINPLIEKNALRDQNYLTVASPENSLRSLKVVELKQILTQAGIKTSGKKADLITRITESVPLSEYESELPTILVVSEKGQKVLTSAGLLIWASKQKINIQLEKYIDYLPADPPFERYGITVLSEQFWQHIDKNMFGLAWIDSSELIEYELSSDNFDDALFWLVTKTMLDFQTTGSNVEGGFYAMPMHDSTMFIQGYILNFIQKHTIEPNALNKAISDYNIKIAPKLPKFLKMSNSDILNTIRTAIYDSPKQLVELQNEFLSNRVPENLLIL